MTYTFICKTKKCENYDKKFDIEKSMNDDSEVKCEKCGCKAKRKYSVPVFDIKCSDFCGKIGK